jgi:hypothetical protein
LGNRHLAYPKLLPLFDQVIYLCIIGSTVDTHQRLADFGIDIPLFHIRFTCSHRIVRKLFNIGITLSKERNPTPEAGFLVDHILLEFLFIKIFCTDEVGILDLDLLTLVDIEGDRIAVIDLLLVDFDNRIVIPFALDLADQGLFGLFDTSLVIEIAFFQSDSLKQLLAVIPRSITFDRNFGDSGFFIEVIDQYAIALLFNPYIHEVHQAVKIFD